VDEEHLVPLTVAVEALELLDRLADRELDVGVPHEEAPAAQRVALGRERRGVGQPVDVGVGDPLLATVRREPPDLHHPARRVQVIQDRLVAAEALVAHDLLGEEGSVLAELHVPLRRQPPESVVAHRVS
jgi:hypothetical protein